MVNVRKWFKRRGLSATAGVLCALVVALLSVSTPIQWQELKTQDIRFVLRGRRETTAKIVIAEINDATLDQWKQEPLSFWGGHYAAAIDNARSLGASWIGLDMVLDIDADDYLQSRWHVSAEDLPNQQLSLALYKGKVVLSEFMFGEEGGRAIRPIDRLVNLPSTAGNIGFTDSFNSLDDVVREGWVYYKSKGEIYPSFPTLLALNLKEPPPHSPQAVINVVQHSVPQPDGASIWINYVGPPRTFPRISFERMAAANLSPEEHQKLKILPLTAEERSECKDAVVLIAPTYTGANDKHPGSGFRDYDGTEILANSLATIVDNRALQPPTRSQTIFCSLILGLVVAVVVAFLPFVWGILALALAMIACYVAAVHAFHSDILLPTAGPLLAALAAWIGHYGVRSWEEARRRGLVENLFAQHVSQAVAEELLENPESARLGGDRREMTILFSDIRGFTMMSENMTAEQVMDKLNDYLTRMADSVLRFDGTLDKYIGDAVMAFWNAPRVQPDHALRAVATAWDMVSTLETLNQEWKAAGKPTLRIGIGINTGQVVVGLVGSEKRENYTVIGDPVNLASRIESLNKDLHTTILLGETTYLLVRDSVEVRGPHEVPVKGKAEMQTVYEMIGFKGMPQR